MYLKLCNEEMFSPLEKDTFFDFIEVIPYGDLEEILVEVQKRQALLHETVCGAKTMSCTFFETPERLELQRIQTLISDLEAELTSRRRDANAVGAVL